MGQKRLLLIDACISNKVASTLRRRGRNALSLSQQGMGQWKDPDVLKEIYRQYPDCVLVTTDDHMPEDHADLVARYKPTLAIVDPVVGGDYDQTTGEEQWKWEVCMRWAHRMQQQEDGSVRRYNDGGGKTWKRPRNPRTALKRTKAPRPTGLASSPPVVPKEDESHEQGQFEFGRETTDAAQEG